MRDITEQLDAELGQVPEPTFEIATTVAAGRRAVRRRRLAAGAVAVAVAAVVGGSGFALVDGLRGDDGSRQAATERVGNTEVRTVAKVEDGILEWDRGSGALLLEEGWRITDQIDDPAVGTEAWNSVEIADSVALEIRNDDRSWWVMTYHTVAERDGNGGSWTGSSVMARPERVDIGFDHWAALQGDLATTRGTDELVAFEGDELVPLPGVEVVHQEPVELGERFATEGPQVAAKVSIGAGTVYWLVARVVEGTPDVIVADEFDVEDEDPPFADFVDFLERTYASNEQGGSEGLR